MPNSPLIIRQGMSMCFYDMPLNIEWLPTLLCNYKCSYCSQGRPKGKDWLDKSLARKMFANFLALNRSQYTLTLSGGEPTMYPHLVDTLEYITEAYGERLTHIYISSNGSNDKSIYERLAFLGSKVPIHIRISIHTDHIKKDNIILLTEMLAKSAVLNYSLMFNPAKREFVHEIFELLCNLRKQYPFRFNIATLVDGDNNIDSRYTQEDFHWHREANTVIKEISEESLYKFQWYVREWWNINQNCIAIDHDYECEKLGNPDEALLNHFFNLKDKFCVMGTHVVFLDPAGNMTSSGLCSVSTRGLKPAYEESAFNDPNFIAIRKCSQDLCPCGSNMWIPKFNNKEEAENYLEHFKVKQRRLIEENKIRGEKRKRLNAFEKILQNLPEGNHALWGAVEKSWYYAQYPDVAVAGMDAGEHYFKYGWKENRNPTPWFDNAYYLNTNPDARGKNPFAHYLIKGFGRGIKPNPNWKM